MSENPADSAWELLITRSVMGDSSHPISKMRKAV